MSDIITFPLNNLPTVDAAGKKYEKAIKAIMKGFKATKAYRTGYRKAILLKEFPQAHQFVSCVRKYMNGRTPLDEKQINWLLLGLIAIHVHDKSELLAKGTQIGSNHHGQMMALIDRNPPCEEMKLVSQYIHKQFYEHRDAWFEEVMGSELNHHLSFISMMIGEPKVPQS